MWRTRRSRRTRVGGSRPDSRRILSCWIATSCVSRWRRYWAPRCSRPSWTDRSRTGASEPLLRLGARGANLNVAKSCVTLTSTEPPWKRGCPRVHVVARHKSFLSFLFVVLFRNGLPSRRHMYVRIDKRSFILEPRTLASPTDHGGGIAVRCTSQSQSRRVSVRSELRKTTAQSVGRGVNKTKEQQDEGSPTRVWIQ